MAETVTIERFSAGLHTELDPAQLPEGASPDLVNVMTHRGDLRVRPGRVAHATLPASDPVALSEYATETTAQLLAAAGGQVYADGEATSLTYSGNPKLVQFKEHMYLVDGVGQVTRWKPGDVKALAPLPTPWEPLNKTTIEQNTNIVDLGATVNGGIGAGVHVDNNFWQYDMFKAPWSNWKAVPDPNANHDEMGGICCRTFPKHDGNDVMGLELVYSGSDNGSYTAMGYAVKKIDTRDLSQVTTFQLTFRAITVAGVFPTMKLCFSEKWNEYPQLYATWATIPIDTTGLIANEWNTVQVSTASLTAAQLNSVQMVALWVDATAVRPTARENLSTGDFLDYRPSAVTLLVSELSADTQHPQFVAGEEYQFCYTLTTEGEESAPSPMHKVEIPNNPLSIPVKLQFTFMRMTGAKGATWPVQPTTATLYARGGTLGTEYVRIAGPMDITSTTVGSYTFPAWDGSVPGSLVTMNTYVERPIAACSLLFPHKGRMLYVGPNLDTGQRDTLFISNWDDADHVPLALTVDTPPLYGGWIVVGEDGGEITGLGAWGSFCLIFKRRGIWQLSGETASDFALTPVSTTHGCIAHATVQQVQDGVTVWLDHNHVWAMTPQGIENIGLPIEKLLKAYAITSQQAAVAVFDKERGWYILSFPDGTAFVLYRTDAGAWAWSRWDGQLWHSLYYAAHLTNPGVYAGLNDGDTIYRLNVGCTDAGVPIVYSWKSPIISAPNAQAMKTVTDVRVYGSSDVEETDETALASCTVTYHRESAGAQVDPREVTIDASTESGRWVLPFSTPTKRYQLTLSGSSSTGGIISALAVDYQVRGVK